MSYYLSGSVGVAGTAYSWIQSYLCRRTQSLRIGRHSSTSIPCSVGVPQGSVLRPLLFSIHTLHQVGGGLYRCTSRTSDVEVGGCGRWSSCVTGVTRVVSLRLTARRRHRPRYVRVFTTHSDRQRQTVYIVLTPVHTHSHPVTHSL